MYGRGIKHGTSQYARSEAWGRSRTDGEAMPLMLCVRKIWTGKSVEKFHAFFIFRKEEQKKKHMEQE